MGNHCAFAARFALSAVRRSAEVSCRRSVAWHFCEIVTLCGSGCDGTVVAHCRCVKQPGRQTGSVVAVVSGWGITSTGAPQRREIPVSRRMLSGFIANRRVSRRELEPSCLLGERHLQQIEAPAFRKTGTICSNLQLLPAAVDDCPSCRPTDFSDEILT